MNIDRLINRGMRMLMNKGINKGIQVASKRGKRDEDMSADERAIAKNTKGNAQKARRGLGMLRRFMR
jgi:hypothetical protein